MHESASGLYILDGHTPVPIEDVVEWGRRFTDEQRRVALDVINGKTISTVFLANDHQFGAGPPILFETMIFDADGLDDEYCERYSTWDEAAQGHARAVAMVSAEQG